jgi:predicted metal-dependent enzyme (double-stranded beta helix superfamily)
MTIMPHNHQMWAVIGIYTGREDNIFWRRVPGGDGGKLEAAGAKALSAKDGDPLGDNIHSFSDQCEVAPERCSAVRSRQATENAMMDKVELGMFVAAMITLVVCGIIFTRRPSGRW